MKDMTEWISYKDKKPPIGATITVLHFGNWPKPRRVEHRAVVYQGPQGSPDPRPYASYVGHFKSTTITHWKPVEDAED